mgnify:FL=1
MLFKFGTFWKTITAIILSWISWTLLGYEFTIVTMLAIMIVNLNKDRHFLV